jgi:hypothetical protein
VVFLEGIFFVFWAAFFPKGRSLERWSSLALLTVGTIIFASPLILFTGECHSGEGLSFQWNDIDRFFHSWTPLNFITLIFPWFFGRDSYDRAGSDYWWQYQFVEMQVAFSIVGLFFILLFLTGKTSQRRWIIATAAFGLAMALGKFFFVYPLVQSLPVFAWFRDPARYWFLVTWAVGIGAAYAWDAWFEDRSKSSRASNLASGLFVLSALFILGGQLLVTAGRPLLDSAAAWLIRHFLLGDLLHTKPLSVYMDRLPEKWTALGMALDPRQPRVFLPLLFTALLTIVIRNKHRWNLDLQKVLLLVLVFADLMAFRMPLGKAFYSPSDIPAPSIPAPQNRSLTLLSQNVSPLPSQYGEMAYPNMNLVSGRPNLAFDANPALRAYDKILADLGWFSWVYKDRDPLGFSQHVSVLQMLGVDQIVSDFPLKTNLRIVRDHYPYVYALRSVCDRAVIDLRRNDAEFNPLQKVPLIKSWEETHLSLSAEASKPAILILQKTFLPGWKAVVNGKKIEPVQSNLVLIGIPLEAGESQVELRFNPVSLRLGFFLFFLLSGLLSFTLFRRWLA